MKTQLTGGDYGRMVCVTVDCPYCRAHRGEPCQSWRGRPWAVSTTHTDRRCAFGAWRRRNRPRYRAMRLGLLERAAARSAVYGQGRDPDVAYVTQPG